MRISPQVAAAAGVSVEQIEEAATALTGKVDINIPYTPPVVDSGPVGMTEIWDAFNNASPKQKAMLFLLMFLAEDMAFLYFMNFQKGARKGLHFALDRIVKPTVGLFVKSIILRKRHWEYHAEDYRSLINKYSRPISQGLTNELNFKNEVMFDEFDLEGLVKILFETAHNAVASFCHHLSEVKHKLGTSFLPEPDREEIINMVDLLVAEFVKDPGMLTELAEPTRGLRMKEAHRAKKQLRAILGGWFGNGRRLMSVIKDTYPTGLFAAATYLFPEGTTNETLNLAMRAIVAMRRNGHSRTGTLREIRLVANMGDEARMREKCTALINQDPGPMTVAVPIEHIIRSPIQRSYFPVNASPYNKRSAKVSAHYPPSHAPSGTGGVVNNPERISSRTQEATHGNSNHSDDGLEGRTDKSNIKPASSHPRETPLNPTNRAAEQHESLEQTIAENIIKLRNHLNHPDDTQFHVDSKDALTMCDVIDNQLENATTRTGVYAALRKEDNDLWGNDHTATDTEVRATRDDIRDLYEKKQADEKPKTQSSGPDPNSSPFLNTDDGTTEKRPLLNGERDDILEEADQVLKIVEKWLRENLNPKHKHYDTVSVYKKMISDAVMGLSEATNETPAAELQRYKASYQTAWNSLYALQGDGGPVISDDGGMETSVDIDDAILAANILVEHSTEGRVRAQGVIPGPDLQEIKTLREAIHTTVADYEASVEEYSELKKKEKKKTKQEHDAMVAATIATLDEQCEQLVKLLPKAIQDECIAALEDKMKTEMSPDASNEGEDGPSKKPEQGSTALIDTETEARDLEDIENLVTWMTIFLRVDAMSSGGADPIRDEYTPLKINPKEALEACRILKEELTSAQAPAYFRALRESRPTSWGKNDEATRKIVNAVLDASEKYFREKS